MLSVIDQHWREHLYEMDYLQEGINLRAMGQQDPLAEWQREGFDMFEAMMGQIEDDFVQYVYHLQVVVDDQPQNASAQCAVQRRRGPGPVGSTSIRDAAVAELDSGRDRRRGGPGRGRGGLDARAPCKPRSGSRRRPAATSRASAGVARSTSSATAVESCAISPSDLADARVGVSPTRAHYLAHRRSCARASSSSEAEASKPDLWDDPDRARAVTTRACATCATTSSSSTRSNGPISDTQTLHDLAREEERRVAGTRDRERADDAARHSSIKLELRALFTGEHDERDAICEVHSGAGGTDAQDWADDAACACSCAGRSRKASRSRSTRPQRGPGGRHHVGDVHHQGSLRVRDARRRKGRAPSDSHLAVRRQPAAPDRVRIARLRSRARSDRGSPTSIRAISGSTRTARRVRVVST